MSKNVIFVLIYHRHKCLDHVFLVYYYVTLGRPRRKWVDNIKMDLGEVGWGGMDWINLALVRDQWGSLVNTVMNHQVP
jgi:hypothetical protein